MSQMNILLGSADLYGFGQRTGVVTNQWESLILSHTANSKTTKIYITPISCPFPCTEFNSVHGSGRRIQPNNQNLYTFFFRRMRVFFFFCFFCELTDGNEGFFYLWSRDLHSVEFWVEDINFWNYLRPFHPHLLV